MSELNASELNGKTALVTGASQGIGLAIAQKLAEHGVSVSLAARSFEKLEQHADSINAGGGVAMATRCDVASYESVEKSVNDTVATFGQLDILVNNAGVIDPIARLADSNPADWARSIDINLKGVYFAMRAAIPVMKAQGNGVIVNMSSGAANSALEGWSHYCAAKAAAQKLTECAHKELADSGITVVGLSPGTVATSMMKRIRESGINPVSQKDWSTHIPPEWAAQAVVYLCGSAGKEFAGTDFSIKTREGRRLVGLPIDDLV